MMCQDREVLEEKTPLHHDANVVAYRHVSASAKCGGTLLCFRLPSVCMRNNKTGTDRYSPDT